MCRKVLQGRTNEGDGSDRRRLWGRRLHGGQLLHWHGYVKSRLRRAREQLALQIAAHDADPTLIQTTLQNLDGWARELREQQG